MFTHKVIGSFNLDHIERWILEGKSRLHSPWRNAAHTIIQFRPDLKEPFVYKSMGNIHQDTIPHLEKIRPNCFYFIAITQLISMYGGPKTIYEIFPTEPLGMDKQIYGLRINDVPEIEISTLHWTNSETFTTENIYLDDSEMYTNVRDLIKIDFDNRKLLSSIIDGTATTTS